MIVVKLIWVRYFRICVCFLVIVLIMIKIKNIIEKICNGLFSFLVKEGV